MKVFKLIVLMTFIFLVGCNQNAKDIPLDQIEKHRNYQDEKGFDKVRQEYVEIVRQNPNSAEALCLLARCETIDDDALKLINSALELNPRFSYALGLKGSKYLKKKEYVEAIGMFRKCIELDYNEERYHRFLAASLQEQAMIEKKDDKKLKLYMEALSEWKIASNSNGKDAILEENGTEFFNIRINQLESEITKLQAEINKSPLDLGQEYTFWDDNSPDVNIHFGCDECDEGWHIKFIDQASAILFSTPQRESNIVSCKSNVNYQYDPARKVVTILSISNSNINSYCINNFLGEWAWNEERDRFYSRKHLGAAFKNW